MIFLNTKHRRLLLTTNQNSIIFYFVLPKTLLLNVNGFVIVLKWSSMKVKDWLVSRDRLCMKEITFCLIGAGRYKSNGRFIPWSIAAFAAVATKEAGSSWGNTEFWSQIWQEAVRFWLWRRGRWGCSRHLNFPQVKPSRHATAQCHCSSYQ